MAKNKNQHYVPKCHLKPFTLNGEGVAINVYNHSNDKKINNASVSGQCSRSYFYGRDLKLENILTRIESIYGSIIKKLIEAPETLTDEDLFVLKSFAFLQMNRTEGNIKRLALTHQSLDEIAYRGFEKYRKEILDISHEKMLLDAMRTYTKTIPTIQDLEVSLIENKTRYDFITSDDPAIATNRLHLQRLGSRPSGMISSGVQIVMPLTPRFYLLCYDRDAYIAMNTNGQRIFVDKKRDVEALNELHLIRSNENIYFQNWANAEQIRREFLLAKTKRPLTWLKFWVGVQVEEKGGYDYYRQADEPEVSSISSKFIGYHSVHIEPSKWLSVLNYRSKIYGYTDGSAVGFVRKGQTKIFKCKPFIRKEIIFSTKKFEPQTVAIARKTT